MTPIERAQNIKATLLPFIDLGPSIVDFISAEIDKAMREANADGYLEGVGHGIKHGGAAAREKAARIVGDVWLNGSDHTAESFCSSVVERIRAMEVDK